MIVSNTTLAKGIAPLSIVPLSTKPQTTTTATIIILKSNRVSWHTIGPLDVSWHTMATRWMVLPMMIATSIA
jgi:hypothetical protein